MQKRMLYGVALTSLLFIARSHAQEPLERAGLVLIEPIDAPSLVILARSAVTQHPQVLAAQAALESRSAFQQAAERPLFNPELQLNFQSSDTDDRTIGISQTLDLAGQRRARSAVALYEHDVATAELTAVRRAIVSELLVVLADYWTAAGLDVLAEVRIDLMRTFADLTLQRQQAGDLTQFELNIANLAYSQAEIEHASAEAARAGADQSLRAVVPMQVQTEWPTLPVELPEIFLEQLQTERLLDALPEIRVQRATVATAAARVDLRQTERRANPTLSFVAGREDDESLIGLNFTMPLNIRNRFTYEVAAARAEHSLARRQAENIEVRAHRRLLGASERYRLTRDAWRSWLLTGEPNLGQQGDLLERLVLAGELSTTDYLVQLNQTLDTAASALELQRQLWLAWFEWLSATGQIDAWLGFSTEG